MKNGKKIISLMAVAVAIVICSGFIFYGNTDEPKKTEPCKKELKQVINLAISHGHCNLPVKGLVEHLEVNIPPKEVDFTTINLNPGIENDQLRKMKINFSVNANTLTTDVGSMYTDRVQSEEIFDGVNHQKITFSTVDVYQLGNNWYQLRGYLSIKGVKKEVMLRATPVYQSGTSIITSIIIDGEVNLFDFGIDYDKHSGGESNGPKMKTMYINLVAELC